MASQDKAATFSVVAKDAASSVLRGVGKEMGRLGKTGGAVFKTLAVAAAAVASAIAATAVAAVRFTQKAIQAAIADDAEQQKLIATLKARGQTTEQATKRVNELIEAGAKLAFTDSEIRRGYEVATSFAKKYSNQQKILATAQDLSRAKGISLEAATKLVGRAYGGSTGALSRYGIQIEKGTKGVKALGDINKKVAGVAKQYSQTFAGQFDIIKISIDETVESIGMAIGGGEGLPTFVRLLEGIRPVVEDLMGEINKNLPDIQTFSRELVEKFLAKLPGYVRTAKRDLPILIQKAKDFIGSVAGFAKEIGSFLGPDGLITAGIAGVGFKMGGLAGGIGAVFAEKFIKMGIDPITATITGTIGGAITAGVVQGFGSALAQAAISKFLGLFKNIPITPTIPVGVPGGGTPPPVPVGGGGISGIVKTVLTVLGGLAIPFTAQTALQDQAVGAMKKGQDPLWKTLTMPWTWPGAVGDILRGGPPPLAINNNLTVKLDGKVIGESVSQYLGFSDPSVRRGR